MLLRVDNIFFVTPDVAKLSDFYSGLLNVPSRRAQAEAPGLMWAEIPVGGMEFSFRKAEATTQIHPRASGDFHEAKPGGGVTISFEVGNTDETIRSLSSRGCKFFGKPLLCTGGMEVISIFQDHTGRAVQLYEARVGEGNTAVALARMTPASNRHPAHEGDILMKTGYELGGTDGSFGLVPSDPSSAWGHITRKEILVGSNLRDGRNLAYSVAFYEDNLEDAKTFYHGTLGFPVAYQSPERLRVDADGTILEFRKVHADDPYVKAHGLSETGRGGIPLIEVRSLAAAQLRMSNLGFKPLEQHGLEVEEQGRRAAYVDYEGNVFEFWQRPDIGPLKTAQIQSQDIAELETWEFQSLSA